MSLPSRGPWVVSATSSAVDWAVAAAALAATTPGRAAVVVIGALESTPSVDLLRAHAATFVEIDVEQAADAASTVRGLTGTHERVLVATGSGVVTPLGDGSWTAADLAAALRAPVVVVTDTGADSRGHTLLALEALDGRRVPAVVIAVGDNGDFTALPVRLAGRIPADFLLDRERFAEAAAQWVDALDGRQASVAPDRLPPGPKPPRPPRAPGDLQSRIARSAAMVIGVALVVSLVVWWVCAGSGYTTQSIVSQPQRRTVVTDPRLGARTVPPPTRYLTLSPRPVPSYTQVCPTNAPGVTPTVPTPEMIARVNAAWKRIEDWLAAKAPQAAAKLGAPESPLQIDAMQQIMSVPFPPDLVASLRRHNGGLTVPSYYALLALNGIFAQWKSGCQIVAEVGPTGIADWWNRAYVPFATAGDGGRLLVDQTAGGHGRVGEYFPETGTTFERWPGSVVELLEGVAGALETGGAYLGDKPAVAADGRLEWNPA
jgi:cell wall assembly regulator SMI1